MPVHQRFRSTRALLFVATIAAFGVLTPGAVRAQEGSSAKTAAQHAALAAKAADLTMVKKHLHHALNCLEGKQGKDYDAAAGDPCKGVGALASAGANEAKVQEAIRLASIGETLDNLKATQHVADAVAALLEEM